MNVYEVVFSPFSNEPEHSDRMMIYITNIKNGNGLIDADHVESDTIGFYVNLENLYEYLIYFLNITSEEGSQDILDYYLERVHYYDTYTVKALIESLKGEQDIKLEFN
jgi:hypothetical protein